VKSGAGYAKDSLIEKLAPSSSTTGSEPSDSTTNPSNDNHDTNTNGNQNDKRSHKSSLDSDTSSIAKNTRGVKVLKTLGKGVGELGVGVAVDYVSAADTKTAIYEGEYRMANSYAGINNSLNALGDVNMKDDKDKKYHQRAIMVKLQK